MAALRSVVHSTCTAVELVAAAWILAGCVPGLSPASGESRPSPKASYTAAPPTPTLAPIRTPGAAGHGKPYSSGDFIRVLEAAPQAFPDELRAPMLKRLLAEAMAASIETYDGEPYRNIFVQGSCDEGGRQRCDVTVSGLPGFAISPDEQDTYRFEVRDGNVSVNGDAQRRGFPVGLATELDATARRLAVNGLLDGRSLLSVEWSSAPPDDAYVLFYGKGLEEGDQTIVLRVDRGRGVILDTDIRTG